MNSILQNKTLQSFLLIAAIGVVLYYISNNFENMTDLMGQFIPGNLDPLAGSLIQTPKKTGQSYQPMMDPMAGSTISFPSSSTGPPLKPEDLLPKNPDATAFGLQYPNGQADLNGKNFMTTGLNVGISTQSGSMKNPNLQLRSDPPIPVAVVSPWNQSVITPDTSRRSFEIGQ